MDTLSGGLIRQATNGGLIRPTASVSLLHPGTPHVFREERVPDSQRQIVHIARDFRVEMHSLTRRGHKVRSVYYVKEVHILAARDIALKTAAKRGLRKIRVVKVSDTLSQA